MAEHGAMVPPHSAEAEDAVIGSLLWGGEAWAEVGALLKPADFYFPAYAAVFGTVAQLVAAGQPVDQLTVMEAGGHDLAMLDTAMRSVPNARHARRYAEIVRERARRRKVMALAAALHADAMGGTEEDRPLEQLVDAACTELLALQAGEEAQQEPQLLATMLPGWIDRIQWLAEGNSDALATGLTDVDRVLGGGPSRGDLVVLAARPSMGKSALALTLARHMAATQVVALLSMEDSKTMLINRQVASAGRVNLADVRRPDRVSAGAQPRMWEGLTDGVAKLEALRLYVDDSPALDMAAVRRKVQQVKRRAGDCAVVMVDYIQLMEGEGDETRAFELTRIARAMKTMAKQLNVVVILLSQLSRKAEDTNAPPRIDHLAESGGLEQAADVIGLLWREARRNPKPENKHKAQVEFAKNKNGPTDTVHLFFDGATQRFDDAYMETEHGA